MGRRWLTTARRRPAWSSGAVLRDHAGEAVKELAPAVTVLAGVARLLRVGPVAQFVAAFGHPEPGPFAAFPGQRELDQHRVAGHRLLVAGMVPAEREAVRRIDRLHDDRAAL